MRIYKEQLTGFAAAGIEHFEDRLVQFLSDNFESAMNAPRAALVADVHSKVVLARGLGLSTERQIAAYVTGAWRFGVEFQNLIDDIRVQLSGESLSSIEKARLILDQFDALLARGIL